MVLSRRRPAGSAVVVVEEHHQHDADGDKLRIFNVDGAVLPTAPLVEEDASVDSSVSPQLQQQEQDLLQLQQHRVINKTWSAGGPFEPPPVISRHVILISGLVLFGLALLWPPLILLLAYLLSKLVPFSFRVNDDAATRRQLFQRFGQQEDLPERFRNVPETIRLEESYWVNARGMVLATSIMIPKKTAIRSVVCFCHGYTDNVSFMKRVENMRLVEEGIAFCAIEYEGHGKSDGALGLITDWERLIDDVQAYFQETTLKRFHNIPAFLMGESMGGAVAYSVYNRIPDVFRGVVFICPMCKISDHMLPPAWVIRCIQWCIGPTGTSSWLGYLPISPSSSLHDVCYRVREKRDLVSRCPSVFARNPRLATARELIDVTQRISNSLGSFSAPFLVLHGQADLVTDPALSQALYEEACSQDKTIRLYEGMWHALTTGETEENTKIVFRDCIEWILARS
jgi:alpha-beta hydrolase superfamily lysophospholipase